MPKRKEIVWSLKEHDDLSGYAYKPGEQRDSDVELIFTRKGVEVSGWYQSYGISNGVLISWNEIELMHDQFRKGTKNGR